ncbi:MAG: type III-A CRISPR-associated RAMP protein Csm4 [Promethearchaeota archaeon]
MSPSLTFKIIRLNIERFNIGLGTNFNSFLTYFDEESFFGSIIAMWKKLFPNKFNQLLQKFENDPPILFSGLFPFVRSKNSDEKIIYFLPKPISWKYLKNLKNTDRDTMATKSQQQDNSIRRIEKQWKKIPWISLEIFNQINEKRDFFPDENQIKEEFHNYEILNNNIKTIIRPRINIDRDNAGTYLFPQSELYFSKKSGLYIILKLNDNGKENGEQFFKEFIIPALKLLEDEGLGGGRSTGGGKFEFIEDKISINTPDQSSSSPSSSSSTSEPPTKKLWMTLSNFKPLKEDINSIDTNIIHNKMIGWEFIKKRGWGYNPRLNYPLIKPVSLLIKRGSILPKDTPLKGYAEIINFTKADLKENDFEHKYLRYSYAFPIPIKNF